MVSFSPSSCSIQSFASLRTLPCVPYPTLVLLNQRASTEGGGVSVTRTRRQGPTAARRGKRDMFAVHIVVETHGRSFVTRWP